MWIPESTGPQRHQDSGSAILLTFTTAARALEAAVGLKTLLREVYVYISDKFEGKIPFSVKVSTDNYKGDGIHISPLDAHYLNQQGLLGKEDHRSSSGWGMTDYTRHFSWRMLDMQKLYEYLSDESLSQPVEVAVVEDT